MTESAAWWAGEVRWWTRGLWIVLVTVWVVGAFMTRQTARQQTSNSRLWQMGIVLLGMWLLFGQGTGFAWMDEAAFPVATVVAMAGLGTTLAGVAFAIWARVTLGANWSGVITVKEGHTLVRRGPYRIVRHPIYAAMFCMLLMSVAITGTLPGWPVGIVLFVAGTEIRVRAEDGLLRDRFGDRFRVWERSAPAYVPWVR